MKIELPRFLILEKPYWERVSEAQKRELNKKEMYFRIREYIIDSCLFKDNPDFSLRRW